VFAGIELNDGDAQKNAVIDQLRAKGYPVVDMTDSEIAKCHIRYMVGGRAPAVSGEALYRFEFPERPGALLRFLTRMGSRWNITLFHYRNHGAAYGRVLVGIQVPPEDAAKFQGFLDSLGYVYWEETSNPAYGLFLGKG